jgi:threonylcarbamoyladenosine tRNA methylthiotransferase MtaB
MAPLRYRITTLGCRVNHAETREIQTLLTSRGLAEASGDEAADLHVVHTCSVTHTAAAKSRHAVRRATRGPGATKDHRITKVFITGCYASTDPEEAHSLVGHGDQVVGHAEPQSSAVGHSGSPGETLVERLAERLDHWLTGRSQPPADRAAERDRSLIRTSRSGSSREHVEVLPLPVLLPTTPARHVRAEVKIQDGCDAHCTFCIIPTTRPTLRSKRVADVVAEARRLVDLGHGEIVLAGVFIGAYGHETALRRKQVDPTREPLAELVDAVASIEGLQRLRISSMEPGDVTEPLLDAMVANAPTVVPHLHLPLQSGSDTVLRRMNRQYRVGDYLEMVDAVNETLTTASSCSARRDGLPPAITTDIICGFPGETDADFERTVEVARRVGYLHMHVFPYSVRRGTAAARWTGDHLPAAVVRRRVRTLIDLEADPRQGLDITYRRRLLDRTVRVILEQPDRHENGCMIGRCDHYAAVRVCTGQPRGRLVNVRITEVTPTRTGGTVEPAHRSLPIL